MKWVFHDAELETPGTTDKYQLLLGVTATFEIRVDDRVLFHEVLFTVVELALALRRWLSDGMPRRRAFEFQSIEYDEDGVVWIRPEGDGWRVGSIHQEYPEHTVWSDEDVVKALADFLEAVEGWFQQETGTAVAQLR
jgi:hypothetical protein